jgi:2-epi-5-epi-valiolone synthase
MQSHQVGDALFFEESDSTPQRSYSAVSSRAVQYDILVCKAGLSEALRPVRAWIADRDCLVVTTPTVDDLYGPFIRALLSKNASLLVLDCDESTKDIAHVERVCRYAQNVAVSRSGLLIGVGGGVCTDITTVAAAWLRRGIRHVRVPTTLVGQVDAGIGYKGGINFYGHKNYLGCFHPPSKVLIAPDFLHSLPPQRLREGFAEIVKIAVVRDAQLLKLVERLGELLIRDAFRSSPEEGSDIIWRAVLIMIEELEKNPYEDQSHERVVDFGHTFSPLLESSSGYEMSHGQAVAVDIALTMMISSDLGLAEPAFRDRILALLCALELPIYSRLLTPELCQTALHSAALHRGGRPNLVLPTGVGTHRFLHSTTAIGRDDFARALAALEALEESIKHRSDRSVFEGADKKQVRRTSCGV